MRRGDPCGRPYGVIGLAAAVVIALAATAAAVAAALVGRGAHAALIAAAAEQDEQDDDPQTVVAAEAVVVIHKITSRDWISEQLHRSFHVMTDPDFGDTRQGREPIAAAFLLLIPRATDSSAGNHRFLERTDAHPLRRSLLTTNH